MSEFVIDLSVASFLPSLSMRRVCCLEFSAWTLSIWFNLLFISMNVFINCSYKFNGIEPLEFILYYKPKIIFRIIQKLDFFSRYCFFILMLLDSKSIHKTFLRASISGRMNPRHFNDNHHKYAHIAVFNIF